MAGAIILTFTGTERIRKPINSLFSQHVPKGLCGWPIRTVFTDECAGSEEIPSRPHARSMAPGTLLALFVLALLGLHVDPTQSETVADPAPTPQRDNQDTSSGGGPYDITTKDPFHDLTENAFTFEYEDTTRFQPMDEEEAVLGPGAITAIVIAVFLGASVLLALIVIMLRKFSNA
ncbi:hypothetical protein AGOR_G00240550 [Albula goreensis]|uniref:Secondary ossification center associated regulator of chondrocyte maturation n=1 Tax=Albula goreensis TaxID=1534307 RepID=A0A8T3CK45_9TELE|nr:hypothetical protein AGOR_G00240550 [Albula goreensis]